MSNYQQYQKYRLSPENRGFKFGKILVILAIIVVVYLIGRAIFGHGGKVESTLPPDENANVNATAITNANVNGNLNANASVNSNINTNAAATASGSFDLEKCTKVFSKGSADEKTVSLTFNVGTIKEGSVDAVLAGLKNGSVPAAFFVTGDVASGNAALVKKIADAHFPIYNFGNSLVNFTDLPESGITEQLAKAEKSISAVTGVSTKPFFRPPYNSIDDTVLSVVKKDGYCPVISTVDALDWSSDSTAASSKDRVLSKTTNGSIILMQAANSITAEILPEVITQLKSKGFEIVDLSTLLE